MKASRSGTVSRLPKWMPNYCYHKHILSPITPPIPNPDQDSSTDNLHGRVYDLRTAQNQDPITTRGSSLVALQYPPLSSNLYFHRHFLRLVTTHPPPLSFCWQRTPPAILRPVITLPWAYSSSLFLDCGLSSSALLNPRSQCCCFVFCFSLACYGFGINLDFSLALVLGYWVFFCFLTGNL